MHWAHVIDQNTVVGLLKRAVASGRVAHAYLFHGPDGVGKRAVATGLSRALQCEGCGDPTMCRACAKVKNLEHPDVEFYMPHPTGTPPEAVGERLRLLAKDNYAVVDFVRAPVMEGSKSSASNKLALYTIDRINATLRQTMVRRPVEGRYRVAIITDADALQMQAANAFLKLLEEPGPQTLFVLTTNRPDALLPTILSRCQKIAFPALPQEVIRKALIERLSLEESEAQTVAILANGSYSRALELARNSELQNDRSIILTLFRCAWTGNIEQQAELVEALTNSSREQLKNQLSLILGWIRDAMLYRETNVSATILNQDQLPELQRFCQNLPEADLEAMARLVQKARMLVEFQVQPRLILIALIQNLGRALRGPFTSTLAEPLTKTSAA